MQDWMETYRSVVFPWHCDHFGHMNARYYAHHFDDASFHLWAISGISHRDLKTRGVSVVTARSTIDFIHEMSSGDLLVVKSGFTAAGNKSVKFASNMYNADTDVLCATQRAVEVFFDETTRRSTTMPDDVRVLLNARLLPECG
jgi:acyl-CoA thioester hydrolase